MKLGLDFIHWELIGLQKVEKYKNGGSRWLKRKRNSNQESFLKHYAEIL